MKQKATKIKEDQEQEAPASMQGCETDSSACSTIFLPFVASCSDKEPNPVNSKLSALCTNSDLWLI